MTKSYPHFPQGFPQGCEKKLGKNHGFWTGKLSADEGFHRLVSEKGLHNLRSFFGLAKKNTVGIETAGMSAAEKNEAVNNEEARRFPKLDTR